MGSSDPILKLLKDFSYLAIRLPRTNVRPLQVLEKRGTDLLVLGEISDMFQTGSAALPAVSSDQQAGFINGKRTRNLDISVGLSLLGNIIGAMTGSNLKLDVAYKRASNLVFEFDNVKVNDINQIGLNKFLTGAKLDPSVGPAIAKALEEDRLFVITSTIKSNKFTTEASQSNGTSVAVEVPIIQQVVGGSVGIQTSGTNNSKVTYTGDLPLVFGFQAAQIEFDKGVFKGLKSAKPDSAALRALPGKSGAEPSAKQAFVLLEINSPFANLKDAQAGGAAGKGGAKGGAKKGGAKKSTANKSTAKGGAKKSTANKSAAKGTAKGTAKGGAKKTAAKKTAAKKSGGGGANKGGSKKAAKGTAKAGAKKGGSNKASASKGARKGAAKSSAKRG